MRASAEPAVNMGTTAPAMARAVASVRQRDKTILSSTAYGVSCRTRAERLALRRWSRRFAPGPVGPPAWFPRSHAAPLTGWDSALCPVSKRGTLAQPTATASVRAVTQLPAAEGERLDAATAGL